MLFHALICSCYYGYYAYMLLYIAENFDVCQEKYLWIGFIYKFDRDTIDRQSLRQSLFAIQLKYIERKIFDGLLIVKHQTHQYFP